MATIEDIAALEAAEKRLAEVQAQVRQEDALREQLRESMPLAVFKPNPFQYRAARNIATCARPGEQTNFVEYPGNGAGKTWGVVLMLGHIFFGVQSPFYDWPLFRNWPFPKHIRMVCHKAQFEEDRGEFWKAIRDIWPKGCYEVRKGDYNYPSVYVLPNGFVVDCVTPDMDEIAHQGVALGGLFFLEPCEEHIWDCYPRAFRQGGIKVMSGTLRYNSEWIDRRLLQDDNTIVTGGTPEMNCLEHGYLETPHGILRGHLPHKSLVSMYENYNEQDRESRWLGLPQYQQGRVFGDSWSRDVHVVPGSAIPELQHYKINIDPHPGKPWVFVVAGVDKYGELWIVDEWPRVDTFGKPYHLVGQDREHGEQFYIDLLCRLRDQYKALWLVLDYKMANTPNRDSWGTSTLKDRLENAVGWLEPQRVDVIGQGGGEAALRAALVYDRAKPIDFTNHPRLHVSTVCQNTIYQIENLCRKTAMDGVNLTEQLDPKFLDFPRGVMSLLTHQSYGGTPAAFDKPDRLAENVQREMREAARFHPEWRGYHGF